MYNTHTYITLWSITQILHTQYGIHGKMKSCHLHSMDGPWEYYTKSDRERQIPYDFAYMFNLKSKTIKMKKRLIKQRPKGWLPEGKGVGIGKNVKENIFNNIVISVHSDK